MISNSRQLTDDDYKNIIDVPYEGIYDSAESTAIILDIKLKLQNDERFKSLLITRKTAQKRVEYLAAEICAHEPKNLDFVVILSGAFMFAADLGRYIFEKKGIETKYHFVKLSSYDHSEIDSDKAGNKVKIELDASSLEGKDVVIIEDVITQGNTVSFLKEHLINHHKVNSIKVACLLYKNLDNPSSKVKELRETVHPDFVGFKIPDLWVAGYGVDAGDDFRSLPFVIAVNEEHYRT